MARAGTTSLWHYLRKHPDIFMSPCKEPNFFDKDIDYFNPTVDIESELQKLGVYRINCSSVKSRRYRTLDDYLSLFTKAKHQRIVGECSVSYLTSQTACEEIFQYNGNAKILISLRNPIDVLFSLYHLRKNMGQYPYTFSDFIQLKALLNSYQLIPFNVTKLVNRFGHNNVKIVSFEELKLNTKAVYLEILDFLGVNRIIIPSFRIYNSSKSTKAFNAVHFMFDNCLLMKFREVFCLHDIGISKKINSLLGGYNERPMMTGESHEKLLDTFGTCIKQLQDITKRDLSHWLKKEAKR